MTLKERVHFFVVDFLWPVENSFFEVAVLDVAEEYFVFEVDVLPLQEACIDVLDVVLV